MKHLKKITLLTCILLTGLMTGCVGHEWSTERYLRVPKELSAADRAIAEAERAGKDVECPDAFRNARDLRDRAYDVYGQCRTSEAIEMAKQAAEKAKKLCPRKTAHGAPGKKEAIVQGREEKTVDKGPGAISESRVSHTVHFEFDSAEIRPSQTAELDRAVDFLKEHPECGMVVRGHTCSIGTDEYNQGLSIRRAKAARQYIVAGSGADEERVTLSGFGESRPAASNATEAGRRLNRRAVVVTRCPD